MQDHLKERLTGAAILVVAVVLLVPELFRGPPSADSQPASSAAPGPPVRSYTIDLRDAPTVQPAAANDPAPATATSAAVEVSAKAMPAPTPPLISPPGAISAKQRTAASSAAASPSILAAAAKPAAAPGPRGSATRSGWTVQVGSFARRDYAERMAKQVAAKGYSVEVAGPDERGLYRVRSALQQDRAAAMALKQKMHASGLKPIVNTAP